MKERQNIVRLAGFRWIHGWVEQGRDHDTVHGIRRAGCDSALESLINGGEEWLPRGCEGDEVHLGNGWVGKAFCEIECVAECWLHLVSICALALLSRRHGDYSD